MGEFLLTYTSVTVTTAETTLVETNLATDGITEVALDANAFLAGDTHVFRLYRKVDGTNYRKEDEYTVSGAPTFPFLSVSGWANKDMDYKVTCQRTGGATNRAVGVRTMTRV